MSRGRWLLAGLAVLGTLVSWTLLQRQGERVPAYRIEAQRLVQTVVATGRVVAVSRAQVGSEVTGVVLERRVREGDEVEAGQVLAVLRDDSQAAQLREAQAALEQLRSARHPQASVDLERAQAQFEQARRETQRRSSLQARGVVSREALEQARQAETVARAARDQARLAVASLAPGGPEEALLEERIASARAAMDRTLVRAAVAGTVLTRNAEPGDLVQPGRVLFEIARKGPTELLVPLDETNLGVLAVGQPARCVADAFPGQPFDAIVDFIAPAIDPQRGTVDVRLAVDPPPAFLRQDMTVSVNVETGTRERALVVPNDALHGSDGVTAWVAAVREGRVERVTVRLGLRGSDRTEVSGIEAGELVLAGEQAASLPDGERVRVSEVDATPQRAGAAELDAAQLPLPSG